jgi:hypothetical protein
MPQEIDESEFPFPLTELDRVILRQTDDEYQRHSWENLLELIGTSAG